MENIKAKNSLDITIFLTFASIYIFPRMEIAGYDIIKYFFAISMLLIWFGSILHSGKLNVKDLSVIGVVLVFVILTGSIRYINVFIAFPALHIFSTYDSKVLKEHLMKSKMIYLSALATLAHSFINYINESSAYNRRYISAAVQDVNESSLAIFCLALIIRKKNKFCGNLFLLVGLLTLSRNYYCAIIALLIFAVPVIRKFIKKIDVEKFHPFFMILLGTIILIFIGIVAIIRYKSGLITDAVIGLRRLINLWDTSNYDRFSVAYLFIHLITGNIDYAILGIPDINEYILKMREAASGIGIIYRNNVPHSFLLSQIRLYGVPLAVLMLLYISNIIKRFMNFRNFGIYVGIIFYAILLGSGLEAYWLFLTCFTLCAYKE